MNDPIVLASSSEIRAQLLRRAGLSIEVLPARIDETALKAALVGEGAGPRDIADTLAEMKARRISEKRPGRWVLGCDQVLDVDGRILSKPTDVDQAKAQLLDLSGRRHSLLSAAVLYESGEQVWRHVGQVRLTMHTLSEDFIEAYLSRNWDSVRHSVGAYKIEEEGVRLFSRIEGDHFTIQGIPLIEFLSFLVLRGRLET
jgi:septum formation protein